MGVKTRFAAWLLSLACLVSSGAVVAQLGVLNVTPDPEDTPARHERAPWALGDVHWVHALIGREAHTITWWQMSVRGVLIFVFALMLVRLARRAFQRAAPVDILLSVLIGSNLSRAFTASAAFVPTLVATAVLVLVYWIFIYASMHSTYVARLVKGRQSLLVWDGELDRTAMARHGITVDDLREAMRSSGIRDLDEVEAAYLERNGSISLLRRGG